MRRDAANLVGDGGPHDSASDEIHEATTATGRPAVRRGWATARRAAVMALGAALIGGAGFWPANPTTASAATSGLNLASSAIVALDTRPAGIDVPAAAATAKKLKPTTLRAARSAARYHHGSKPARITFRATAQGRKGTGKVQVKVAGTWRSVKLSKGRAVFPMPRNLAPRRYQVQARYRPNAAYRWSTIRTTITVARGTTGLSLVRSAATYREDQTRATLTARALASGAKGAGRVTFKVAGRTYTRTLVAGKASLTMPSGMKPGTYRATAAYRKNANYQLVTRATTVTVTAKPVAAPPAKAPAAKPSTRPAPTKTPAPTTAPTPVKQKLAASLLSGAWNFRDLAGPGGIGYATADGKHVATGVIFRSSALTLTASDVATVRQLGIAADYDLRRPTEIAKTPDTSVPGMRWVNVDIYSTGTSTGGMAGTHRAFVTNDIYRHGFGTVLAEIAPNPKPVVFHCAAGKDRTGWTAALLLSIANVPRATITADYLASNQYLNGTLKPGQTGYVNQVDAAWLDGAFDQVATSYGSMHAYLTDGLGLTDTQIEQLRAKLVG